MRGDLPVGLCRESRGGPPGVPSRGTSKSAVSRTLGRRLTAPLAAHLEQRLDGFEVALFLDGVVIAGQTVIVVLGLTREGTSGPWGCD